MNILSAIHTIICANFFFFSKLAFSFLSLLFTREAWLFFPFFPLLSYRLKGASVGVPLHFTAVRLPTLLIYQVLRLPLLSFMYIHFVICSFYHLILAMQSSLFHAFFCMSTFSNFSNQFFFFPLCSWYLFVSGSFLFLFEVFFGFFCFSHMAVFLIFFLLAIQ